MKQKLILTTILLSFAVLCLQGCTKQEPEPAAEPQTVGEEMQMFYRGEVTGVLEDGTIEVTQHPGFNYGNPVALFHMDDAETDTAGGTLQVGAFVQVEYDGIMTRSIPPQGVASSVKVIASFSDGVVINGTVLNVDQQNDEYYITIQPFDVQTPDTSAGEGKTSEVVLYVQAGAVEGMEPDAIRPGAEVSAVSRGIATASIPPQVPVEVLLPYTE